MVSADRDFDLDGAETSTTLIAVIRFELLQEVGEQHIIEPISFRLRMP